MRFKIVCILALITDGKVVKIIINIFVLKILDTYIHNSSFCHNSDR